jgi:transcriptional regulator with XRE-family HTH domain
MLSLLTPEKRVPAKHPLRVMKRMAEAALAEMSPLFDAMYSTVGRSSSPPERLLKASLLMACCRAARTGAFNAEQGTNYGIAYNTDQKQTGLGRGYISELERGLVVPSLHALAKLAKALEVTVADLVVGDSTREQLFDACSGLLDSEIELLLRRARSARDAHSYRQYFVRRDDIMECSDRRRLRSIASNNGRGAVPLRVEFRASILRHRDCRLRHLEVHSPKGSS